MDVGPFCYKRMKLIPESIPIVIIFVKGKQLQLESIAGIVQNSKFRTFREIEAVIFAINAGETTVIFIGKRKAYIPVIVVDFCTPFRQRIQNWDFEILRGFVAGEEVPTKVHNVALSLMNDIVVDVSAAAGAHRRYCGRDMAKPYAPAHPIGAAS